MHSEYKIWLDDFKVVKDKCVLWDLIKYKIRQWTIVYSKAKACKKRAKIKHLEESLKNYAKKCDTEPSEREAFRRARNSSSSILQHHNSSAKHGT